MTDFVQGGMFGGLTFAPLESNPTFGPSPAATTGVDGSFQPLNPLPTLPSNFAPSATSAGNVVASNGGLGQVSPNVGPTVPNTQGIPSNATPTTPATSAPSGGISSGSVADYFFRAVIVILGFIFVAIGLNMFKPGIVPVPVPGLRR